jgi:acyl-coenzyme A synthetase/AMP-(fatty) acid ligase
LNLRQLFDLSLVNRAKEAALEWEGVEFTFGELEARSNRMAHALKARGLTEGDRLCVWTSISQPSSWA